MYLACRNNYAGRRQGEAGKIPRSRKNVAEKWFYLPELYKLIKVLEGHKEMGGNQITINNFVFTFHYRPQEFFGGNRGPQREGL